MSLLLCTPHGVNPLFVLQIMNYYGKAPTNNSALSSNFPEGTQPTAKGALSSTQRPPPTVHRQPPARIIQDNQLSISINTTEQRTRPTDTSQQREWAIYCHQPAKANTIMTIKTTDDYGWWFSNNPVRYVQGINHHLHTDSPGFRLPVGGSNRENTTNATESCNRELKTIARVMC